MPEKTIQYRGIPVQDLIAYFLELEGEKCTDEFPIRFEGPYWTAEIMQEQEVYFSRVFKVNAVHVRFQAEEEQLLNLFIQNYRKKTFRAGG